MPMSKQNRSRKPGRPPETQEQLEAYVPYLVNRLASFGQNAQNRRLAVHGISNVTLRTLSVLHIQNGLTVNEIAARAFADQSTASRAIDAMVAEGLVERRIPDEDMRRREVVLTEAGSTLLHACWPLMEDHYALLSEGIDPEEIETCRRVLLRMLDNLQEDRDRAAAGGATR
jgi:DNA-binding MarR family transcriptional regulator